jgi:hypothetical protein
MEGVKSSGFTPFSVSSFWISSRISSLNFSLLSFLSNSSLSFFSFSSPLFLTVSEVSLRASIISSSLSLALA